ncbi:hypothetical protein WN943_013085 [Citrus x changshan-huyou]
MLRILHSISQDLEKIRDRKSLHIKHAYGFDEVVRDDVCYEDNEENGNFVSLDNIIPSEENTNWPFVSTTNPQYKDIDLDQLPKFDAYLDIVGREEGCSEGRQYGQNLAAALLIQLMCRWCPQRTTIGGSDGNSSPATVALHWKQ